MNESEPRQAAGKQKRSSKDAGQDGWDEPPRAGSAGSSGQADMRTRACGTGQQLRRMARRGQGRMDILFSARGTVAACRNFRASSNKNRVPEAAPPGEEARKGSSLSVGAT